MDLDLLARFLKSPVLALAVCLLLGAISVAGRSNILLARILLSLAWGVGVLGIAGCGFSWVVHVLFIGFISILAFGFSYWLKPHKTRPIRITGLTLEPLELGKPFTLRVDFINDSIKPVSVTSRYSSAWVKKLPSELDAGGIKRVEDEVWNYLCTSEAEDIGDTASKSPTSLIVPPGVEIHTHDESKIVVSEEAIRLLDSGAALYFMGLFTDVRTKATTPFCTRVDKFRNHGLTLCRQNN